MAIVGPDEKDDDDAYAAKSAAVVLLAEGLSNLRTLVTEVRTTNAILKAIGRVE